MEPGAWRLGARRVTTIQNSYMLLSLLRVESSRTEQHRRISFASSYSHIQSTRILSGQSHMHTVSIFHSEPVPCHTGKAERLRML